MKTNKSNTAGAQGNNQNSFISTSIWVNIMRWLRGDAPPSSVQKNNDEISISPSIWVNLSRIITNKSLKQLGTEPLVYPNRFPKTGTSSYYTRLFLCTNVTSYVDAMTPSLKSTRAKVDQLTTQLYGTSATPFRLVPVIIKKPASTNFTETEGGIPTAPSTAVEACFSDVYAPIFLTSAQSRPDGDGAHHAWVTINLTPFAEARAKLLAQSEEDGDDVPDVDLYVFQIATGSLQTITYTKFEDIVWHEAIRS